MSTFDATKVGTIQPLKDHVIVSDMGFKGRTLASGITLMNDDKRSEGIRPRWGKVFAVGPDQKDVSVGQWILITHGRWTRGSRIETPDGVVHVIRRADTNDILLFSDTEPLDETLGVY